MSLIKENGVVTQAKVGTAMVKTTRSSTCKSCSAHGSCEGAQEREVEVMNPIGAKEGDAVTIAIQTGSMIKLSALLYLFPVFSMILGAALGSRLAPDYGVDESALSAFMAFLCFILSFLIIRFTSGRIAGNDHYHARIIQIKKKRVVSTPTESAESVST
ncbi:MAG: SoxR reducing system RseC family protein [Thermodesulfobacteriota bacterium]